MGNGQEKRPGGASQVGSASGSLSGIAPGKGSRSQARYANVQRKENGQESAVEQQEPAEGSPVVEFDPAVEDALDDVVSQLKLVYEGIGAGAGLAIRSLDRPDSAPPAGGVAAGLLHAAMNAVMGDVIKEMGNLVGGGMPGGATSSVVNKSVSLAFGKASEAQVTTAAGLPLMDAFDKIQVHKFRQGKSEFFSTHGEYKRVLRPLSVGVIRMVETFLKALVDSEQVDDRAQLRTMTEWMNFNARHAHGAEEGSDSNISLGGVMGEHLLDPSLSGKAANKNMKGIMRIKCRVHDSQTDDGLSTSAMEVFSMKLVGMHDAVRRQFQEGYETVSDVPVNKIVELYSWFQSTDPTPLGSAMIGADGQVKWVETDTDRRGIDMREVAEGVRRIGLGRLS